ncbi:MAG: 2-amino-4-hydroxy-6-hydroxymethyldihydropteridine diphosphokinase [Gammaproteobacteria bacterium]|nr:MAG: 2-amino-4-hydroxy-6-hydroxymethyldihydropteridine diphosphokinase [Gammaproteobacteria bacterium]
MIPVYVSIGSNVDPEYNVCRAARLLRETFGEVRFSPVYRNPAVGFEGEDFLNLAAAFDSALPVESLLARLRAIEDRCGRRRGRARFAPRTLDLDLLLYGDAVLARDGLVLPRPEILEHAFVLRPLAELAPELTHPVAQRPLRVLWQEFAGRRGEMRPVRLACLEP